jgi:hypothetical protein
MIHGPETMKGWLVLVLDSHQWDGTFVIKSGEERFCWMVEIAMHFSSDIVKEELLYVVRSKSKRGQLQKFGTYHLPSIAFL